MAFRWLLPPQFPLLPSARRAARALPAACRAARRSRGIFSPRKAAGTPRRPVELAGPIPREALRPEQMLLGELASLFAEEARQRLLECLGVADPVAVHRHDEPQLRVERGFGLQVNRLDVQQRLTDRDHQQVAADDPRNPPVPERQRVREDPVQVDLRLDLLRIRFANREHRSPDSQRRVFSFEPPGLPW